jgi:hypothetical protein
MKKILEAYEEMLEGNTLNEAAWSRDPYQFKRDLAARLVDMGHWIRDIPVSDRYYTGVDHSPKEKAYVDKVYKLIATAVDNLDTAIQKAKKIRL